jgi:ribosomal protein L7/L12
MEKIVGTIVLAPSFHGEHTWRLNLSGDQGNVEAEHPCVELVRLDVTAATRCSFVATAKALHSAARESAIGSDGMTCAFDLAVNDVALRCSIWCPSAERHGALWELIDGMWRLFYEQGPPRYRPYLEHVAGYFRRNLPLVWVTPSHARLYGRLSSDDLRDLDTAFSHAPAGCAVDMSNFEGMGTILFPIFRAADENTVESWIVNDAARHALLAAGVAEHKLVQSSEPPARSGRRHEIVVVSVDAPVQTARVVAALLRLSLTEAHSMLQTLPCSLGHFDAEDVQERVKQLRAAGAKVSIR